MNQLNSNSEIDYKHTNILVMLLFCGYVVTWYLQVGDRIESLGAIRFEFIYAILLTIMALFVGTRFESPLYKYIILFILIVIIQIPFSYDINTYWLVFFDRFIKFSFMGIFIVFFIRSPKNLIFFIGVYLLAFLKMGQEGLHGKVTGGLMWENQGIPRLHGPTLLYRHPNSFSGTQISTLPFLYYLFPISPIYIRIILLIQFAFIANITLFTGSRTGYVALVLYSLYIIYKSKYRKKAIIYIFIISILAIPLIPQEYLGRFESIFTENEVEGTSAQERIQILKDSWAVFIEHPLGVGVGAFPAVRFEKFGRIQDTHNLYLQIATNLGIQGVIVFFLLVFKIFKTLNELMDNFAEQISLLSDKLSHIEDQYNFKLISDQLRDLNLLNALTFAVRDFTIIRLLLGLFGMDLYEIYWWFAVGLTIAIYNIDKVTKVKTDNLLEFIGSDEDS